MKIFKKIFISKLFYLVLLLGVFVIPIFKFNLQAQEDPLPVYSDKNLAVPNLESKEYLGDGVYRVRDVLNYTLDYNVYNGIWTYNSKRMHLLYDIVLTNSELYNNKLEINQDYYFKFYPISEYSGFVYQYRHLDGIPEAAIENEGIINVQVVGKEGWRLANVGFSEISPQNITFKLQIEKSDTATPYTVPLQPYLWHEKQLSYNDGFEDGFRDGEMFGYNDGYEDGLDDGFILGYNHARADYGIYINGEWISAVDYGDIKYNDGYDDGENDGYNLGYEDGMDDTHNYYNNNGLFIHRSTPKGHLVIDYDLRYGEPYFYLQDFHNEDVVYFGYQHNRWLEKAFDWAYDNETDFLAINDLYAIQYGSDEVLYKYFFYKYDTDSVYFYNDNGTLFKIVERVDFDYYVYEVPELTQEEQARIDNAYDKGMRDYGYYDSESEEYLTAVEYGDIQYNLGVQSTRDKAYSDGFVVAMWYSHLYGYDWLHATYYDLIAERPILYNVHDITSFAFQEGHDEGFNNGRDVGYDLGYDDGKIDGIDIGYDDGYNDGESDGYEDGYNKGYQVAVDNTYDVIYDDIYKIGYKDGQKTGMNNKFYSGLEKWIVPAIIVVLFFGLLMLFPKHKED